MKNILVVFTLAGAFVFSGIATADTLPLGADRFGTFAEFGLTVDIPQGRILVVTDVIAPGAVCELLDGTDVKVIIVDNGIHLQTGIEFSNQLRTFGSNCHNMTVSGYWLAAL
jgi:hypothetical protein